MHTHTHLVDAEVDTLYQLSWCEGYHGAKEVGQNRNDLQPGEGCDNTVPSLAVSENVNTCSHTHLLDSSSIFSKVLATARYGILEDKGHIDLNMCDIIMTSYIIGS